MVRLDRDEFPDSVLTDPWPVVTALFAARAAQAPQQDRSAAQLVADWTAALAAKRGAHTITRRHARRGR